MLLSCWDPNWENVAARPETHLGTNRIRKHPSSSKIQFILLLLRSRQCPHKSTTFNRCYLNTVSFVIQFDGCKESTWDVFAFVCVCMSIPWEGSIMNNRTEAARESVNIELFACLRVLLCVHRQNGSIFYKLMYCFTCVCVCVSEWQWSIDLTALPEGVHTSLSLLQCPPLIDCFQHRSGDVSQSVSHTVDFQPKSTHSSAADSAGPGPIDDLWSPFHYRTFARRSYRPTCGIRIPGRRLFFWRLRIWNGVNKSCAPVGAWTWLELIKNAAPHQASKNTMKYARDFNLCVIFNRRTQHCFFMWGIMELLTCLSLFLPCVEYIISSVLPAKIFV